MASVLDDVVHRQVDQTHIKGAVLFHEGFSQVIDRGVRLIVILIGIAGIAEERIPLLNMLVLRQVPAVIEPLEEARVLFRYSLGKKLLQEIDSPGPALCPSPGGAEASSFRRRLAFLEKAHAPQGLSALPDDIVLRIGHCPSQGIRPHIQTKIPCFILLRIFHFLHLPYSDNGRLREISVRHLISVLTEPVPPFRNPFPEDVLPLRLFSPVPVFFPMPSCRHPSKPGRNRRFCFQYTIRRGHTLSFLQNLFSFPEKK